MKLIVADTGPIHYLIQIGCADVLPRLVESVILPVEVLSELRAAGAPQEVKAWADVLPPWIEVWQAKELVSPEPEISPADRAAISLAKELRALLLMDDRRARQAAAAYAVTTIGTLGILEAAAAKELISLPTAVARLQGTSMFITAELVDQVLQRDASRRSARFEEREKHHHDPNQ